jgi:hypothetical protein
VVQAGHRRGVDDVPFVLREQARQEGADAVDDAPEVHADDPLEVAPRQIGDLQATTAHAGVVAHEVDPAEAFERRFRERLHVRLDRRVGHDRQHVESFVRQR